jgi:uncharacterized membrane protein
LNAGTPSGVTPYSAARPPFRQLKKEARELLRENWNKSVLTLFIPFIFYIGIMAKLFSGKSYDEILRITSSGAFDIISIFLALIMSFAPLALAHGFFQMKKGEKQSVWGNYFAALRNMPRYIPCVAVACAIGYVSGKLGSESDISRWYDLFFFAYIYDYWVYILICGAVSSVLFISALYFALAALFTPYIITENARISGIGALAESFRLTRKIKWRLLFLGISFAIWYFLGLFALVIGYLWALAYYYAAVFVYYVKLSGKDGAAAVEGETSPKEEYKDE